MPGISVVFDFEGGPQPDAGAWERALERTRCDAPSRQFTLFRGGGLSVGASTYDGYPLEVRENERAFVCLEGRLYGAPPEALLERLLEFGGSHHEPGGHADGIRPLLRGVDGDFVALVYAKQARRLWISGDALGRLALYAWHSDRSLVVSRDQRFLVDYTGNRSIDRLGLAQQLLLGYPLGRRTLLEGVERATPGHDYEAGAGGVRQVFSSLGEGSLEQKDRAGRSLEANAAELGELLVSSCRARRDTAQRQLLGLSGGIDSRAVGAAMVKAGVAFGAATFLDSAGTFQGELAVAEEVAKRLGAPWRKFETPPPPGSSLLRMLRMKLGLNPLGEAYGIDLFEMLRAAYGPNVAYWSGDGGDKLMPDHRPHLPAHGRGSITQYIVGKNHVWDPGEVSRLTGVPEAEILASVEAVVEGYPERGARFRYVRFLLAERAFRWTSEGEDCNRHYYWTVAPFQSLPMFMAAMGCPDHQKTGYALYRSMLRQLGPAVAAVADANLGVPIGSPLYVWYRRTRELSRRFPRLQRMLRRSRRVSTLQPQVGLMLDVVRRQAQASAAVRGCFSPAALEAIAAAPAQRTAYALECLLTATSAVEEIADGRSTLTEFAATRFG